ncbi:MAG: NADH-quinone oxidoreductase subunit N [Planctomycetota bacterium]|nr:NADH-quinone oxidoreductase subunit N [Planctomycetota bacterium]
MFNPGVIAQSAEFDKDEFQGLLDGILESIPAFSSELVLIGFVLGIFLLDLLLPLRASKHLAWVAILGCFIPAISSGHHDDSTHSIFHDMLATDSFSAFFKQFFLFGTIPVILLSYLSSQFDGRRMGEYYGILLAGVLGAILMASSTHFLMIFMALELLSISSYVLVGYIRRDHRGAEAALKYVIYGSVAAAVMVYGLSLFYGLTGSAQISDLASISFDGSHEIWSAWSVQARASITILVALLMVFMGIAYKMSTLPMHFWAPDVYEGAPTPVTAFLSVLSKAAGFALALRFLAALPAGENLAQAWEKVPWVQMMIILSIVTMTFGNMSALWQTNLKRMLAYSSIAHAGYMMMAFAILHAPGVSGSEALGFYLLTYMAMNFGAFAVVVLIENRLGSVELKDYQGLGRRAPFISGCMVVFLFSLIGVPPTAGFTGKWYLFLGVIDEARSGSELSGWYYSLVFAAAINTAISAYYYLKVAKEMYLVESEGGDAIAVSTLGKILVAAMAALTFYLFIAANQVLLGTQDIGIH